MLYIVCINVRLPHYEAGFVQQCNDFVKKYCFFCEFTLKWNAIPNLKLKKPKNRQNQFWIGTLTKWTENLIQNNS